MFGLEAELQRNDEWAINLRKDKAFGKGMSDLVPMYYMLFRIVLRAYIRDVSRFRTLSLPQIISQPISSSFRWNFYQVRYKITRIIKRWVVGKLKRSAVRQTMCKVWENSQSCLILESFWRKASQKLIEMSSSSQSVISCTFYLRLFRNLHIAAIVLQHTVL